MRYTPAEITVLHGETIRFVVHNAGNVMHETVLGTLKDLQEHVAPDQSGEMIWQFTEAGEFHIGCLIPGHFEAGLRGRISVVARSNTVERR